jgi:hypothetical protein
MIMFISIGWKIKYFFFSESRPEIFLLVVGRIRIQEAQNLADPDPEH